MMDIEDLNSKAKKISNDLRELGTKKEKNSRKKINLKVILISSLKKPMN